MKSKIREALSRLNRVKSSELDCATLANLVGYRLQQQGCQVEVIEGEADGMPVHYRLSVNGQEVDPFEYYYDEPVEGFQEEEIMCPGDGSRYPVYGPERTSGPYMTRIWARYLAD